MRFSQAFIPTRKEDPADAEMPSHKLLVRAGFIEQVAAGIYNLLPMGWKAARRVEKIVREEMDRAGAQEMLMPIVQPAELWERSGRWQKYGPELLRFKDRKGKDCCLGPTHEEVITDLISRHVRSYRDMPLNLYQIQAKFRDEIRPRAGLLRGREFLMKDAYSFDTDLETADASYQKMREAYTRIFTRCGLEFQPVEADSGNIGGAHSHEFQVLAKTGEDRIVHCAACDYTANEEKAELHIATPADASATPAATRVETPGKRTIDEVAAFLDVDTSAIVKTLVFLADGKPVLALVRGDHTLNEVKLKAALDADVLLIANDTTVSQVTGAPVGFAGPVGLSDVTIIADHAVMAMPSIIVGANAADAHLSNVAPGRDFTPRVTDLRLAQSGDACPRCGEPLDDFRGIEVGHIFILGTRYSEPLGATYLSTDGDARPVVMGCYGIGITRTMAAAVEQNHDDNGIIWPMALAPYQVQILPLQMKVDDVVQTAERLYETLRDAGVDVLLDDRDIRAGGKFKDADLIGIPLRIVIGSRGLKNGEVELKHRATGDVEKCAPDDVSARILALIADA